MSWNISSITKQNDTLYIKGFHVTDNRTLVGEIRKTTLIEVLRDNPDFTSHEGDALSYVSASEVYIISILMNEDPDEVINMKMGSFVSADELIFNGEGYMGLPLVTFMLWKGMINTDID